ncbi:MAG: hypothetical protein M3Z06_07920 [Actinomycetota bacterium]|nr:hypothetical protein [Actinomycetota bacterium]
MTYTAADARRQLLDEFAVGADDLGLALVALGEAYERLDEHTADRLELQLFRPVQAAYGRAKRSHAEFSARHDLAPREFPTPSLAAPAEPREEIGRALDALHRADETLSTLQDSLLPVEVGDREVRAGISEVRALIAPLSLQARELLRTLGR